MTRPLLATKPRLHRAAYRAAFTIIPLLPITAGRLCAWLTAWAVWWIDARGRSVVQRNLTPLAGTRRTVTQAAIRRNYISFLLAAHDSLHLSRFRGQRIRAPRMQIDDPCQTLTTTPLAGPMVWATVHVNFELAGAMLVRCGLIDRLEAVALSHGDPSIDRLFAHVRATAGLRTLLFDSAPLASLRALTNGRHIGLVGDRDYTATGRVLTVANGRIRLPPGPAALPVQRSCPVVPFLLARVGWSRYRLLIGPRLLPDPSYERREQVADLLQRLANWYTRFLTAVPLQWVAFHPAWHDDTDTRSPQEDS